MVKKSKRTALILDDDLLISNLYKATLEKAGFVAEVVLRGERAVEIIEGRKPDVVLLDLVIGDKSGADILKEIKSNSETSEVPVIIASSITDKKKIEECTELGAAGYIAKGHILPSEAVQQIEDILKKTKK